MNLQPVQGLTCLSRNRAPALTPTLHDPGLDKQKKMVPVMSLQLIIGESCLSSNDSQDRL